MAHEVTIGGERLGAGKRNKVSMREYERSTHDLSYVWRSTMAAGTLVPFMSEVALPGDTFDIDLNCDVLTHPTIGPLFGSYKIQLDVFQIPIRLYNGKLHMNMLEIGNDMSKVLLPQIELKAEAFEITQIIDNQQINPSCIFSYLGMRGLGYSSSLAAEVKRQFNAIPWLGYWDIYKNYYANKQEEIGMVIHKDVDLPDLVITDADLTDPAYDFPIDPASPYTWTQITLKSETTITLITTGLTPQVDASDLWIRVAASVAEGTPPPATSEQVHRATAIFTNWTILPETGVIVGDTPTAEWINQAANQEDRLWMAGIYYDTSEVETNKDTEPKLVSFPLSNIDNMRKLLLKWSDDTKFVINDEGQAGVPPLEPYSLALQNVIQPDTSVLFSKQFSQEGLGIKTYNSDLFNNWISTEWIDGPDGISAVTAIDTSGGSFTIDELNLSKKIYDMLNRIAISGGSYDDWLDAVYTHDRRKTAESPMYLGGLIQNLVFQEVVSNAASQDQPLGTLAGRGTIGQKRKGGEVVAKIDEPSYLMGIISLTPNVDYSQGNKWDTNLETMNDFHKPALDEIGFQDLITDQMAWWDTMINVGTTNTNFKSAGKQPAWINYMTNVNQVKGNFADQTQQMFMVLNRRYGVNYPTAAVPTIADLTTYIDPTKFNHIFADTRRDAQNFWAQIGVNITARRKMSARVMPNL